MEDFTNGQFYNPSRGNLSLDKVMDELVSWMREKPENFYDIIVGCDSSSEDYPNFPVVIVILRVGEGGRFFLKRINYPDESKNRFSYWRQRILQEVLLSCELALFLKEHMKEKTREFPHLRHRLQYIHADVGEHGKTRDMVKEVVGLIRGNGFEPKIKPESYVASTVADRFS